MKGSDSIHRRIVRYAMTDVRAIERELNIHENGYTDAQAEESRKQYGENSPSGRAVDTVWYRLRRAFINPFTVVLFILAVISFMTDVFSPDVFRSNAATTPIILMMLLVSGVIRFIQEMRAKKVSDYLTGLIHTRVSVLRNGVWTDLTPADLVVGDRVRFSAGERVPADIRLTSANDLFISQAVITGESAVLEKSAEQLFQPPNAYADYRNIAFMGSAVISGIGEGIVLAVGKETVYGGFAPTESNRKNGFDRGAGSIAWVLIRFMIVLVPVVFIASGLTKGDWFAAFLFALSVAVGLTPEMLPMIINACLARGSAAMGQKQTIVKNINAMQSFGSMDVLCVDKTGTLTGDTVLLEYYMDILGNESRQVLNYAYLNSLYHTGVRNHLDQAVLKCSEMPGQTGWFDDWAKQNSKLDELPFDHERRFASVLVKGQNENLLIVKGSIDEVCSRCAFAEYRGQKSAIEQGDLSGVHAVVDEMLEDGMKVLAVACKPMRADRLSPADEQGLTLLGYLAFFDAPKKSAASAISKLRSLHVDVKVLTGDRKSTAVSVCRRLGIDTAQAMTGNELEQLTTDELPVRVERTTVFAELSPRQKTQILQTLRQNGHTVGFLGDGMNDLPATVEADVGISVDTAAEAVKESADVILLKKDLNVLEEGVLEGRRAFANMTKYITITASSNFGNILSIVIAGVLLPFFPMTSIQLLLLNLLYDTLCLVLPWDNVDSEIIEKPQEWSGRTLGRFMRFFGPLSSVFDFVTFAFLFYVLCPGVCGGSYGTLPPAEQVRYVTLFQTGWFLESMWTQVLILHLLRTRKVPMAQSKPSFPMMVVTILGVLLFTGLCFTPIGGVIGMTVMPASYFLFLLITVMLYLLLVSLLKGWYFRKNHEAF